MYENQRAFVSKGGDTIQLEISTNMVTTLETIYLLSNYDGYIDGDRNCIVLNLKQKS